MFGFPLRVGEVRLGTLDLHSTRPGPLKVEQHLDALILANVVADAILLVQAEATSSQLTAELRAGTDFHTVVNQASGMIAVQLNVSVGQALIWMRMHAFVGDRPLVDVAQEVAARGLRFDTEPDG